MSGFRAFVLSAVLLGLGSCLSSWAQGAGAGSFQLLDRERDSVQWCAVQEILKKELLPDEPEKVAPIAAYRCKSICWIGLYEKAALVIIRSKDTCDVPDKEAFCRAVNVNLRTNTYKEISSRNTLWLWRYIQMAHLESGPVSDVVFSYDGCRDCEPDHYLSSFQFNTKTNQWQMRIWPTNEDSLLVGTTILEDGSTFECVYKIADLSQRGQEDIAIWCKEEKGLYSPGATEGTTVYSVSHGKAVKKIVVGKEAERLHRVLCAGVKGNELCEEKKGKGT
jgi:hypothetical protein